MSKQSPFVYVISGDPISLARPRFNGTHRMVYDSQKQQKHQIMHEIILQHGKRPKFTGPLQLEVEFTLRMNKASLSKLESLKDRFHIATPDCDNLVKWVCDIVSLPNMDDQGILMSNDSLISRIIATKIYGVIPMTTFIITPLGNKSRYIRHKTDWSIYTTGEQP